MKKKGKDLLENQPGTMAYGSSKGLDGDEVLDLNELFDVQGGIESENGQERPTDENCGLGCYGGRSISKIHNHEK